MGYGRRKRGLRLAQTFLAVVVLLGFVLFHYSRGCLRYRIAMYSRSDVRCSRLLRMACESSFWGGFQPPFLLPYPTGCS